MTLLIAAGTSAAPSPEFTLGQGQEATLVLTPADIPADAVVDVLIKSDAGPFVPSGAQLTVLERVRVLRAPGTWMVARRLCSAPVGVERQQP